ncbi:proline dehydrogenase family protein [Calditrichota bacterium]
MDAFNKFVVGMMPLVPKFVVGRVASRYIAGKKLTEAVTASREFNQAGAMTTMDLLGEHCTGREMAVSAKNIYLDILEAIHMEGLDSNISLKPTHMGLKMGYDFSLDLVRELVDKAKEYNNFVRIDMEDISCTDDTLKMYFDLRKDFDNVGVVIQAYLRRTIEDIKPLIEAKANLRLCKGIYNEPRSHAYKNRAIIIRNFAFLLEELLRGGCYIGIATHCEETVWHALQIIHDLDLPRDKYEFQMLLGVEHELRKILLDAGHRLRVYVPYGEEWYAYSTRRLKENPKIAGHVMRDFFGMAGQSARGQ